MVLSTMKEGSSRAQALKVTDEESEQGMGEPGRDGVMHSRTKNNCTVSFAHNHVSGRLSILMGA
jgi:hypothetical protein